jgi:hypothetical protein
MVEIKFLMIGTIVILSGVLLYTAFAGDPTITIVTEPEAEEKSLSVNITEEPSGQISGVLDGPTVINITALNTSK